MIHTEEDDELTGLKKDKLSDLGKQRDLGQPYHYDIFVSPLNATRSLKR
jgi:hypothetical protein